ncbi:MAG: glycoside hydrolase TIM-barrel-like domain-containing protein, partial [Tepidiforma sp.]
MPVATTTSGAASTSSPTATRPGARKRASPQKRSTPSRSNPHYNRPGGIESGTPTAWVPECKPIWFTELGCPAID